MSSVQKWNSRQEMLSEDFEIFHYKDSYLKDVDLHHHDFFEIYFFLGGDVSYTVESRKYSLLPGDILLISPNELHQPVISDRPPYERIVLWINCSYLRNFATEKSDIAGCFAAGTTGRHNLLRLSEPNREMILSLFKSLLAARTGRERYDDILARAYFMQALARINQMFEEYSELAGAESMLGGKLADIVSYIDLNHTENILLDDLSERFYISKYHMSREFQKHYGVSIHRYMVKRRLMTAKGFLADGEPPTAVFSKCGFSYYANFYRAFKNEYGLSPAEFAEYSAALKR